MADIVEEQMGDILSAFGIPDLAKHIVPIPITPLDEDDDDEQKEDAEGSEFKKEKDASDGVMDVEKSGEDGDGKEESTKSTGGEEGGEAKKEKDASDEVMDVDESGEDGDGKEEATKSTGGEEETKDDEAAGGNFEDDAAMETNEGTDGSTDSQHEVEAPPQDGQTETSTEQPRKDVPDLGLKQSVASLSEDGHGDKDSTLIKQLLKSTSKPVMTSRVQGDLPLPDASSDVLDEPNLEAPPVESLTSLDEFDSYLDRCKEGRELVEMKMAIMGRTSRVSTYQCPNLSEEQIKVLNMGKEIFQCPGCNDTYLFKASLDAHLDRRTVLVTFRCKWCTGRKNLVFYNKCTFLAHLHNHNASEYEIECIKIQASVSPVNALDSLKIFTRLTASVKTGDTSEHSVQKSSLPSNTPHLKNQSKMNLQATSKSAPASVEKSNKQGNTNNINTTIMYPKSTDNAALSVPIQQTRSFLCMGCKRRYERMSHLRAHLDRPHPEPSTPGYKGPLHQCNICKLILANKCKLIMHSIIHGMEDKTPIPCPECGCLFTDLKSLLIHQNDGCLHWMTRPLFKCTFCSKYATTFPGLVKHFEQNHVEVFYKCPLCQLAFRNNQSASEHSMQVHKLKSVTYGLLRKCPFCKSVYSERNMLASHFDSHYQNGLIKIEKFVFSCSICSKPFDFGRTLRNHLYSDHGRSNNNMFNCDLCLCAFSTIDSVMQHRPTCNMKPKSDPFKISVKTSKPEQASPAIKPDKQFVCAECGEKFPYFNMDALRKHMFEKHKEQMKDKLAGPKKPEVTTAAKEKGADVKPQGNSERVYIPVATKKVVPVKVDRFTDLQCGKCQFQSKDRLVFEKHIVGHKTEESFSQCHECGLCFTVEGSLKKHLFIKHKIKNMATFNSLFEELIPKWEEDMKKKKLEEKEKEREALKTDIKEEEEEEDAKAKLKEETKETKMEEENEEETSLFKCKVCRVEFENDKALTVHARSHGLAYLQHTLTRSPEKAVRLPNSQPAASPDKVEKSPEVIDKTDVKPIEPNVKGVIPSDTDGSTSSDEINSMEDKNGD